MGQSQKAAEEAVEGGLVLPLVLELLSQLKQALPPPVQHPQSQPESTLPPIRAPLAEDEGSPPHCSTEAPQVERKSQRGMSQHDCRCTHGDRLKRVEERRREQGSLLSVSSSQGQVRRSRVRQCRRLAQEKDPFPSLLSACTRKRGQRKSESVCCLSGTAVSQSLFSARTEAPPECEVLLQSFKRELQRRML